MTNPLAEKIGPLPLFAYVGIGVVGILVYHKYHASAGSNSTAPTGAGTTDASGVSDGAIDPSTGTVGWSAQFSPPPAGGQSITSNLEWSIAGADYLAGLGTSPQLANSAVNAYVNGEPTTPAQQSLIDQIIQYLGNAPEGVIGFINSPVTPTTPIPTPAVPSPRHNPSPARPPAPPVPGPMQGKPIVGRTYGPIPARVPGRLN